MNWFNLGTVFRFEVRRTLARPAFWLITLAVPVLIGLVTVLIVVSGQSSDRTAAPQGKSQVTFAYVDHSGVVSPDLATRMGGSSAGSAAAARAEVRSGRIDAAFVFPQDLRRGTIRIDAQDAGVFENGKYEAVAERLLSLSAEQRIGDSQLSSAVAGSVRTSTTTYRDGAIGGGFPSLIVPALFLALFYVVILMLSNTMLNVTLEEKENRVAEMILTTIPPTNLLVGKILAVAVEGLVQMLVFLVPVAGVYAVGRERLNLPGIDLAALQFPPQQIILGALVLLTGLFFFTGALVTLGSVMPTAKDAGPVFGVLMVAIWVPFYIFGTIIANPNALIVQVFTYFPVTAPVTALMRNAFGSLAWWQGAIVIVEMIVFGALLVAWAVQLFRRGVVSYHRRLSLRRR
jgi:ABC-2 type transport system permease protein